MCFSLDDLTGGRPPEIPTVVPRDPTEKSPVEAAQERRRLRQLRERNDARSLIVPLNTSGGGLQDGSGLRVPPTT